jgi:hypothetical protein
MGFKEWFFKLEEMTGVAAVGGGTGTADIARFVRPLGWYNKKKKSHVLRTRSYPKPIN